MPVKVKNLPTVDVNETMNADFVRKAIEVCANKIATKGDKVGLSFYAFFKNKNDEPKLLMDVATWWISTHQLDHFEKAVKIKRMLEAHGDRT